MVHPPAGESLTDEGRVNPGVPRADTNGATTLQGGELMAKYRKLIASLGWLAVVLMSAGAEWKW